MSIDTGVSTGRPGLFIKGMDPLQDMVNQLISANQNVSSVFRVIGERIRAMQIKHFDAQKDMAGRQWADFAESTLEGRRGGGIDAKLLQDTGRAKGSIAKQVSPRGVAVGSNVKYLKFHQFLIPSVEHPRQVLFINAEEAPILANFLIDELIAFAFR